MDFFDNISFDTRENRIETYLFLINKYVELLKEDEKLSNDAGYLLSFMNNTLTELLTDIFSENEKVLKIDLKEDLVVLETKQMSIKEALEAYL